MASHLTPRPSPPDTFDRGIEMVTNGPIIIAPPDQNDSIGSDARIKIITEKLRSKSWLGDTVRLLRIDRSSSPARLYFEFGSYVVMVQRFDNRLDQKDFGRPLDVYYVYRVYVVSLDHNERLCYHPLVALHFFSRNALDLCREKHDQETFDFKVLRTSLPGQAYQST